ncbi:hypothetical protein FRC09_009449 [Ceratobasidium sp. 395]|nr:hypothetical protein FRC09_009449 [Ceratobasidium sp. 395]
MVKFEALLGQLSVSLTQASITVPQNSSPPNLARGVLFLQGRDLLGPGDAKTAWELLGYEVGIQQFKITLDAPACGYRVSYTDRPMEKSLRAPVASASVEPDVVTFAPRQWTQDGRIAVTFTVVIPERLLPPRGMTYRYQLAASVTVAIINKDLGMGPNFMHRIANPVSLEVSFPAGGAGWPWPQQNGLN